MGGDIAGTMGFRVRETVKAAIQLTWYEQTGTDVRRHHDQLADTPGRQLSDEWYSPVPAARRRGAGTPPAGRDVDDQLHRRRRPPAASRRR